MLCHFIIVPSDITKEELGLFITQTFYDDVTNTIDSIMVQNNSDHLISPYMRDKSVMYAEKLGTIDEIYLKSDINSTLFDFGVISGNITNDVTLISPQTIDVGSEAIVRAGNIYVCNGSGVFLTLIDFNNPANATGELDTCSTYLNISDGVDNFRFGTFTNTSGTTFVCTDGEAVGDVATGSIQTFTGLTIAVTSGDYIGADETVNVNCRIYSTATGGGGVYYSAGNFCDPSDSASYALLAGDILSLYGTGTESGGGWAGEYCGVAVAEFCGVTPAEIDGV